MSRSRSTLALAVLLVGTSLRASAQTPSPTPAPTPSPASAPAEDTAPKLTPYAAVYFNGFHNSSGTNNQDVPLWANAGTGDTGATARQSRFGVRASLPVVFGAKTSATPRRQERAAALVSSGEAPLSLA